MRHETFSFCVLANDLLCTGRREDLMWLKRQFLKEYALETNLMGEDDDMEKKAVSLGRGENGIGIGPDRRHVRSLLPELGLENRRSIHATVEEGDPPRNIVLMLHQVYLAQDRLDLVGRQIYGNSERVTTHA